MSKVKATGAIQVSGGIVRVGRFNLPPTWDTIGGSLGTPFENTVFSVTPGATDPDTFPDPSITYSLVSGSLPSGLSLNTSTSEISGTTSSVESDTVSNFTLRAADGTIGLNLPGKFVDRAFSITVLNNVAPSFNQPALTNIGSVAELSAASLAQITATDPNTNPQTITFSEVGAVLATENLSIDSTGNVTGTPADTGGTRTITFTVRASDGTLTTDQDFKVTITDAQDPVWVSPAAGLITTVNELEAISTITLVASDDNPVSYSITSGALPGGLTLNSSNGEITGTPSDISSDTTFTFEVTATDTIELDTSLRSFSIKVLNTLTNSLRFNDDDNAFLSSTVGASPTDADKWTFSTWTKRGNSGTNNRYLFSAGTSGTNLSGIDFATADTLDVFDFQSSYQYRYVTTQLFRDFSAWYHIVVAVDIQNVTPANRVRIYVNGSEITDFSTETDPGTGVVPLINSNIAHNVGRAAGAASDYFDGYTAETIFVDGQQLTPTSFGAFDSNGDWNSVGYSGAFGTNGFHLDYAVAPGTGNGGGTDVSGNANHFTDNNLAADDQFTDSPTDNYCIISSVATSANLTLSEGNLKAAAASAAWNTGKGSIWPSSGKWFWEYTVNAIGGADHLRNGIVDHTAVHQGGFTTGTWLYGNNGNKFTEGTGTAYGNSYTTNDVISVAVDLDGGGVWFAKNGTWQNSATQGEIEAGTTDNAAFTGITGRAFAPYCAHHTSSAVTFNFGNGAFTGTVPAGFNTLNTSNLPIIDVSTPTDYFETLTYTGNATGNTDITGLNFMPDFVWIKNRSQADEFKLVDAVRGVTIELSTDSNTVESTDANGLTTFNSDGFELGTGANGYNDTGESFVAWNWKEGATPGFDIVAYTGTGSAKTEAHSLGAVPAMMMVKNRNTATRSWSIYHKNNTSAPETDYIAMDTAAATADLNTVWNDTGPTSSVFTVGTDNSVNENTKTYIAYLWAEIEGFSKFGSYVGNASADGPFVWCGFRPAFVMIKDIDQIASWQVHDNKRDPINVMNNRLFPDDPTSESGATQIDFLSNGFKLRTTGGVVNTTGNTLIFAAFAEHPFKTTRAR